MAVQLTHTGAQLDAAIAKVQADYADVSGVTAQAADVAQGKQFVDSNGVLTTGTLTRAVGMTYTVEVVPVKYDAATIPFRLTVQED